MTTLVEELKQCGDWYNALSDQVERLERIDSFLLEREREVLVYPPRGMRLNALKMTSLAESRALIVAQDPYPGNDNGIPFAMGLAFSVPEGLKKPGSLKNIHKELNADIGVNIPEHGNLTGWAKQGVLLLNVVLSLDAGISNSHKSGEWKKFIQAILEVLNDRARGLVFLSWGRDSHKLSKHINSPQHSIIKTSHPSNLGARKSGEEFVAFLGSGCFSQANNILIKTGVDPINWDLFN